MFTTRSSSNRSLRRRVGIAASTAALAVGFLGASPAGAAAGDLDTQFSGDGKQAGITGTQNATASFLQLDAKVVVAGNGAYDDGTVQKSGTYVARYTTAGALDPAYGDGGVKKLNAITGFEWVRDIAPAGSGSMLVRLRHRHLPRRLRHLRRQAHLGRSARPRVRRRRRHRQDELQQPRPGRRHRRQGHPRLRRPVAGRRRQLGQQVDGPRPQLDHRRHRHHLQR